MKNELFDTFVVKLIYADTDGIIAVTLRDKMSDYAIMFVGVYILPENTVYGR